MASELDYMEYSSDANAQAAYVTDSTGSGTVDAESTADGDYYYLGGRASGTEFRIAQSFQLTNGNIITKVGAKYAFSNGSPTGSWTVRIETDDSGVPSGTLVDVNASVVVSPPATDTWFEGTFSTSFSVSLSTTYWMVILCDDQTDNVNWTFHSSTNNVYSDGTIAYSMDGGSTWNTNAKDLCFKITIETYPLNSFSESTIKTQGSYSLKAVADATDSLNDTLTKTF